MADRISTFPIYDLSYFSDKIETTRADKKKKKKDKQNDSSCCVRNRKDKQTYRYEILLEIFN